MNRGVAAGLTLTAIGAIFDSAKPTELTAAVDVAQQIEIGEEYCASLTPFKNRFVKHLCPSEPAPFHKEVDRDLQSRSNLLLESWRGSAKSTLSTIATLHGAIYRRFHDKLITSATGLSAIQRLRTIKTELESNSDIRSIYGELVGPTWNEDEITLRNGVTIRAKGSSAQIRGDRYDEIDFDDSERDDKDHSDVRTQEQRDKYTEWVDRVVFPTLRANGCVRVLYTPLHRQSYWRKMAQRIVDREIQGWAYRRYPVLNASGESNWPGEWPLSRINAIRAQIGPRAFRVEYLLDPVDDTEAVVDRAWIKWFDEPPERTRWYSVLTVDSAISQSELADYTALCVAMRATNGEIKGHIYIPEVMRGRWTLVQQAEQIYELYRTYKPDVIGIPKSALEKALREFIVHYFMGKGWEIPPLVPLDEDRDKVRRVEAITPLLEQGYVWFHRKFAKHAVGELLDFPNGEHDDMVDAIAHAISLQQKRLYPEQEEAILSAGKRAGGFMSRASLPLIRQVQGRFMA